MCHNIKFLLHYLNFGGFMKVLFVVLAIVITIVFSTSLAFSTARVQVIHNSALPAAAKVDVYINGMKPAALDDFAFRSATPFVDLPSGVDIVVTVALPTSQDVNDGAIATFNLGKLEADGTYVVVANGILGNNFANPSPDSRDINFTLYAMEGKESASNTNVVALNVFHGVTDAPAVDIYADINSNPLIPALDYAQSTGYVELPASDYTLTITVAGNKDAVAGVYDVDISSLGGGAGVVFASGFLNTAGQNTEVPSDYTFGLFVALPDGTIIELGSTATVRNTNYINFNIFPNPTNDRLMIAADENIKKIELLNLAGVKVKKHDLIDTNEYELSTQDLPNGLYIIKIDTPKGSKTSTFVVSK
jgi:hypothetical protein